MAALQNKETDIYGTEELYQRQLEYIKKDLNGWTVLEKDKPLIFDFLTTTTLEGVGLVQRTKYVYGLKSFTQFFHAPLKSCKTENLKEWLVHMNGQYKQKTISTRWYALKKFYCHLGQEDLYTKLKIGFRTKGMKLPEELLTKQDVAALLRECRHIRDKALVGCLYESGCRIGEFLSRKVKHVVFDQYGATITVDGKTGMRRIRVIESVPLLANWLENHPLRDDPNAPLWTSLQNRRTRIEYNTAVKVLRDAGERAGIKKAIYPHLFRHSRATELAQHLTEQQLKVYMGWTNSSEMASIYVHLSGRDIDNAIINLYQDNPKPPQDKPTITVCPRCTSQNHFSSRFCNRCGAILNIQDATG